MLAPSGDRPVPALFESLNCLVFVAMKLMEIVQEIVSAIRGRMPRNLGAVVGVGRRIRLDEGSSSGLASLRTSELL